MPEYLIYFNQQWVGDHTDEWFDGRARLVRAVLDEIKAAGDYVFAGGLEEDHALAFSADSTSGNVVLSDRPHTDSDVVIGGMTIVDVADEATARVWAGRIAEACGWPQEMRRFRAVSD